MTVLAAPVSSSQSRILGLPNFLLLWFTEHSGNFSQHSEYHMYVYLGYNLRPRESQIKVITKWDEGKEVEAGDDVALR